MLLFPQYVVVLPRFEISQVTLHADVAIDRAFLAALFAFFVHVDRKCNVLGH
jgi:hypothetical protein